MKIRSLHLDREAYGGPVLSLSLSAVAVMLGFGLFGPFLPLYSELLGATTGLQIGVITSAFMVARLISSLPFGSLSDRIGRKPTIIAGLGIYTAMTFASALAADWPQLIAIRLLQGFGGAMIWPTSLALIADVVQPGKRGRALGFFNASAMTGIIIGPALGGAIQAYADNTLRLSLLDSFRVPFYFAGFFSIVAVLLAWRSIHETRIPRSRKEDSLNNSLHASIAPKFKRTFYTLMTLRFAEGFGFSFITPLVVFFVEHEFGLSPGITASSMAVAFFASGLASMVGQIPGGRLADRGARKKIMLASSTIAQIFTVLIPLASSIPVIIVFMALRSLASAFFTPSLVSMQEDVMPRVVRGRLSGIMDLALAAGAISGPIIGFFFYDFVGRATPFQLSAAISVVTIVAFMLLAKEPKKEEAEI